MPLECLSQLCVKVLVEQRGRSCAQRSCEPDTCCHLFGGTAFLHATNWLQTLNLQVQLCFPVHLLSRFSRDLSSLPGVWSRSSRVRSCCKKRDLVTLTFAPLEGNRGSRAQAHTTTRCFLLLFWCRQHLGALGPQDSCKGSSESLESLFGVSC